MPDYQSKIAGSGSGQLRSRRGRHKTKILCNVDSVVDEIYNNNNANVNNIQTHDFPTRQPRNAFKIVHAHQPFTRVLLMVVVFFLQLLLRPVESSNGVPDAHDLAVGDWDVKLKCGKEFYQTLLFPSITEIVPSREKHSSYDRSKKMLSNFHLPPLPFLQVRTFPCQLTLHPDHTFSLSPTTKSEPTETSDRSRLLLRGTWKVEPNPYCITDRFYDELHLETYPRKLMQRKRQTSQQPATAMDRECRRLSMQLHCRMCGRYASAGPWRTIRGKTEKIARLTRGMLIWSSSQSELESKHNFVKLLPLGASFQGKRMVYQNESSVYEEQEDQQLFGY